MEEKDFKTFSGFTMIIIQLVMVLLALSFFFLPSFESLGIFLLLLIFLSFGGFVSILPNDGVLVTLFGEYKGTIKKSGFFWLNPFLKRKKISLKAFSVKTELVKTIDKAGHPVQISAFLKWQVDDTFKAHFTIDNYASIPQMETELALKEITGGFCLENYGNQKLGEPIRNNEQKFIGLVTQNVLKRIKPSGLIIQELQLLELSYSGEMANKMSQKQKAISNFLSKKQTLEGAIELAEKAVMKLQDKNLVTFSEKEKNKFVSDLILALCQEKKEQ
ncbi:MAG: hypothetical protein KTR26_05155 [Flammeovirgaceae bacterium]|nr:hypothetical protein [Flammeovirgaceae bacterium]